MNESNAVQTQSPHLNEDPLTHEPGAHPVATGIGAAGGGTAFAAIGLAVGGPVGGVIGALLGAVAGGLGGSVVGETIEPTDLGEPPEPVPWHTVIPSHLPSYEEIALRAYCLYELEGKPAGQDVRHWLQAEASLKAERPPGPAGPNLLG